MYIKSIKMIPIFIEKYFKSNKISIEDIKEFEDILINSEYYFYNKNKYATKLNYKPNLMNFYIKYSKIDKYGNCKYEDELNISKSISNEIYKVKTVNDQEINISLDYNDNESLLIINVEY